jgi:putative ABC transport system substrate-binding protein
LVGLQPDIIFADSTAATVALQRETRTIPIVFAGVRDPVANGIVARLDRPSGNITGFATFEGSLGGKWLELHDVGDVMSFRGLSWLVVPPKSGRLWH